MMADTSASHPRRLKRPFVNATIAKRRLALKCGETFHSLAPLDSAPGAKIDKCPPTPRVASVTLLGSRWRPRRSSHIRSMFSSTPHTMSADTITCTSASAGEVVGAEFEGLGERGPGISGDEVGTMSEGPVTTRRGDGDASDEVEADDRIGVDGAAACMLGSWTVKPSLKDMDGSMFMSASDESDGDGSGLPGRDCMGLESDAPNSGLARSDGGFSSASVFRIGRTFIMRIWMCGSDANAQSGQQRRL